MAVSMTSIREANACGIRGGHKFEPFFSNQPTAKSESIENATSQVVLKALPKERGYLMYENHGHRRRL